MHLIDTEEKIAKFELERALVGTFIDHSYSREKLEWVLDAQHGFDAHVGDSFHLLIPHSSNGYSVNYTSEMEYGVQLARAVIQWLDIKHAELPCIVFRASGKDYYYLKLGHRSKTGVLEILGRISDLAVECSKTGPQDPVEYRKWVNMQTAILLRREKALSAIKASLPAISGLLGSAVDVSELA